MKRRHGPGRVRLARGFPPRSAGRAARRRLRDFEVLERRLLLHGGVHEGTHVDPIILEVHYDEIEALNAAGTGGGTVLPGSVAANVPALASRPGAPATLYLDFDGHFEAVWGGYSNITTPAFDRDGNPASLTSAEVAAINEIWARVAEDFAPFNVNVTTVAPGSFANGVALRASIGGNGSWIGPYGGVAYVDSFTNSLPNTVYVFSANLGNGHPKYVADAISHEAGHGFGLQHQSLYNGSGGLVDEYYAGDGTRAPIMGNSYATAQSVWYYGTSISSTTFQDDLTVLSRPANGFGYRPDDHGNNSGAASSLAVSAGAVSGSGVIEALADLDYFRIVTGSGNITLNVNVAAFGANLDASIELRNLAGAVLVSANPSGSLGASVSANVAAGTYFLVVRSDGQYGEVGQYSISGTVTAGSFTGGLFRNTTGRWYLDGDGLGGTAEMQTTFGLPGDLPVAGDRNADGRDDLGIFRNGRWFFDLDGAGGAAEGNATFGLAGDLPVLGDWNGDGSADLAIFRNGVWYLDAVGNDGIADRTVMFGTPGDVPVAGDWNGDGSDDLGIFRAGRWFLDTDGNGGAAEQQVIFGVLGDRPVVDDWDGDGIDEPGVCRAGNWYLDYDSSGGPAEMRYTFGVNGDLPVAGDWDGPGLPYGGSDPAALPIVTMPSTLPGGAVASLVAANDSGPSLGDANQHVTRAHAHHSGAGFNTHATVSQDGDAVNAAAATSASSKHRHAEEAPSQALAGSPTSSHDRAEHSATTVPHDSTADRALLSLQADDPWWLDATLPV